MPQNITFPVGLGDEARDTVTGFTGIVVALTEWFNACQRATLQPAMEKGKMSVPMSESFDVEQLVIVKQGKVARAHASRVENTGAHRSGGPMPAVSERSTPRRREG
jgi:hypothetical protein